MMVDPLEHNPLAISSPRSSRASLNVQTIKLPRLRVVLVQPSPPPKPRMQHGNLHIQHGAFMSRLWWMHKTATLPWGLLPPKDWADTRSLEDVALREWRDRMEGGEGCWDVDESVFASRGV